MYLLVLLDVVKLQTETQYADNPRLAHHRCVWEITSVYFLYRKAQIAGKGRRWQKQEIIITFQTGKTDEHDWEKTIC